MTPTDRHSDVRMIASEIAAMLPRCEGRVLVGVVGAPGAGKSTFAAHLAGALGSDDSVIVPMDGFHLAGSAILGTPLADRKGAIDTFDGGGYLSILRRIRARDEPVVYAPEYVRGLEEPIAGSIPVPRSIPFVITEGNYLLADTSPWDGIRELLDIVWFVDTDEEVRLERLVERHVRFGKDLEAATTWAHGPDQANARYILSTRMRADRVIDWS